jgi:restriction system protein
MATSVSFAPIFVPPPPPDPFIGRERDIEWLHERIIPTRRGIATPISVIGDGGIGKTALVAEEIRRLGDSIIPIWFGPGTFEMKPPGLSELIDQAPRRISRWPFFVILDGAESIPERQILETYRSAMNRKDVSSVVVTSRAPVKFRGIHEIRLERMAGIDVERLLRKKISLSDIDENTSLRLLAAANGHPGALSLIASMATSMSSEQLRRILSGDLYDIKQQAGIDDEEIERASKPVILTVGNDIMKRLKKEPMEVYTLSTRQFEILIADLLRDMGYEVTLTKATRDGGADILASIKNDLGKFLYLIDAKKYSEKNKIGVDMVRTLLGTLADYRASSAMLVTTSSFTKDARAMEKKHEWQLALHDYIKVAEWIQKHGTRNA